MAKILFTWELGDGSGHITPYINLIRALEAEQHELFFAARCLGKVYRLFENTRVTYLQAPTFAAPVAQLVNPIDSFAKILNNYGYANAEQLAGMIKAWKNLYNMIKPDLVIFDYSPTALLAARDCHFKRLRMGTGFYLPTEHSPSIGLEVLQGGKQDSEEILSFENKILANINQALTLNRMQPLSRFYEMHEADLSLLQTFPELDHYPGRENANYTGITLSPSGITPEWPKGNGAKIFLYTKPFSTLPKLLENLNARKLPTLVYTDGVSDKIKEQYASETLVFVDRPLDMQQIGKTADIGICNGNHGTLAELLLMGVPVLTLPLQAEQNIMSLRLEKTGAGLSAPKRHPDGMRMKLDMLINEPRFKQAAMAFAKKYEGHDSKTVTEKLVATIDALLAGGKPTPAGLLSSTVIH